MSERFACQYLMYVSHSPSFPPFSIFFKAALRVIFALKEDVGDDDVEAECSFSSSSVSSSSRFLVGGMGTLPRSAVDSAERSPERSSANWFRCFFISSNSMRFFVLSISSMIFLSLFATSPLLSCAATAPSNTRSRSSCDNCFFISNKSIFFFVRSTSSLRLRSRFATAAVSGKSTAG